MDYQTMTPKSLHWTL